MNRLQRRRATNLLHEQQMSDLPYHLQQWIVASPGLYVREEDIIHEFPDTTPQEMKKILDKMVKASMLFPVATGVYYKNIRTIEARAL